MSTILPSEDPSKFWSSLDDLVRTHPLVIERPKGSTHPRYPDIQYPLDYGYLEGTKSSDGGAVDIWQGGIEEKRVCAVAITVDLDKRDSEIKVLVGCTEEEMQIISSFHNKGQQSALLIRRAIE